MGTDVTAASSTAAAAAVDGATMEADVLFGTRSSSDRPHSISLHRATRDPAPRTANAGLGVLVGVGIGAAAMYYLDPEGGARRRARVRDRILSAVTMAPDVLEGAAHDVGVSARRLLADARSGRLPQAPLAKDPHSDWSPTARLIAGTLGAALALLGARRRDALGAAVGVIGSALLARGVTIGRPREAGASSMVVPGPGDRREADVAIERAPLPDEV